MARELDQILVIDVEATCWPGDPPGDQQSEIIEIGLCPLDVSSCTRGDMRSILVRPERSTISAYCTKLTTLTQAEVDDGISFSDACRLLVEAYKSRTRIWASFGDYDRLQFQENCEAAGVDYPFGSRHINVKSLFAIIHNLQAEVGLDRAMKLLGYPLEGTHHRGGDDAWNIARILGHILRTARGQW
jgi:inhibitor of KinA sporulation pathway (predicted exonuclease)